MKVRSSSIKQKLTGVIMLTSVAALVLAAVFFAFKDVMMLRAAKERNLRTVAQILATNSQGALTFSNAQDAAETLGALRAKHNVRAAAIFKDGQVFARYEQPGAERGLIPASPGPDGSRFGKGYFTLVQPIELDGERIGTVYLLESTDDISSRLREFAGLSLLIVLASVLFAFLVSSRLQRVISDPILDLARTAGKVSTEKNYAIRARKRADDEIGVLIDSFNEMLGRIERNSAELQELNRQLADSEQHALAANQAKSAFLARMSHELRTPLNAIIGYSEMLQEEAEDLQQDDLIPDLQKIHGAGKHLLSLINDILDLSKIEAGKVELFLERFEVGPVLDEIRTTIDPLIRKNRNRLEIDCPEQIGVIRSDLTKLRQMLFNLLSNASKFTEDGTIRLDVHREADDGGDWITFRVADTGIGMTPEQLEGIFDAFAQADASTTRRYGGTGLGLAITKRFAEMLGGRIGVESEVGRGTVFTISLPAEVAVPEPTPEPPPPEVPLRTAEATVLCIDDDPGARDLLSRYLTREGLRVVTASGGPEGLKLARKLKPDVITLDVMMPGMDGWAVLSALKGDPELAQIPVVIITIVVEGRGIGYALGAADVLTKPLSREQVVSVIRRFIPHGPSAPVLVVEDDPAARELLARYLEGERCRVLEAENGRVALEVVRSELPALILLDLTMPEMDGFEFVEELRRKPEWREIPVIVITARDLSDEDRRRLNGGVYRIVEKGAYTREQLLGTVRALVNRCLTRRDTSRTATAGRR